MTIARSAAELLALASSRERVVVGPDRYFVKRFGFASDWIMRASGDRVCRQYLVWQAGIMDQAPDHTVVAMGVTGVGEDAVLTIVMREVGGLLVPPGEAMVPAGQHAGFIAHMAALSAAFGDWDDLIGLTQHGAADTVLRAGHHRRRVRCRRGARADRRGSGGMGRPAWAVAAAVAAGAAGPRPARGDHRAAVADAAHVLAGRLEAGQPWHPPGRADHPAGLGLSRRRARLLGPVLVSGAQPGPAARAQRSSDRQVPGVARTPRDRHQRLVGAAARPVHDRDH